MLANLTLKSRLFLSYLVYLVFLSIPGAIAPAYFYLNSQKFVHQTPEIRQKLVAHQLSESKIKLQESILGYVSTKDQVFVESYNVSFQQLNNAVAAALRSNIAVLNQPETAMPLELASSGERILLLTQQLNDLNQYILDSIKAGKTDQAIRTISADETKEIWLKLTAEIEKLRVAEIQAESLKIQEINTSMRQLMFIGALATLIFVLLAIALGFFMAHRILGTANQLLDPMVKSSAAIAQEMNDHQETSQNQARMFSITTPQLRDLHEFCQLSIETTTSVGRDFEQISTNLMGIRHQLNQLKALSECSDQLVDHSKKISLNISLKTWEKNPETSRMLILLNTEIKSLTNSAQKIAQSLHKIVVQAENIHQPVSFKPPTWGGNSSEYPITRYLDSHYLPASLIESMDFLLIGCEKIKIQISEWALYSQQQATNSEQLLQNTEKLEESSLTTACGMEETTIQMQKLKQVAWHLKWFLGDRAS